MHHLPKTKPSKTKQRILDTALELFNNSGTRVITTNHIADACHMSPGNLYYHYRNKEQIIYSLFERMISAWDEDEKHAIENIEPNKILDIQLQKTFHYVWQYRFIHRELAALLDRDEKLKELCTHVLQRRSFEIEEMLKMFIQLGIIKPLDDKTIKFLAHTALYFGLFWQPYLEVIGGKPTEENVQKGVQMIKQLIAPYLL